MKKNDPSGRKTIGVQVDSEFHKCLKYLSKKTEISSISGYVRFLVKQDIEKRIEEGDDKLRNILENNLFRP